MRLGVQPARQSEPLVDVVKRLLDEGRKELFVVGDDGRFRGAITLADLTQYLTNPESIQQVTAGDVVYTEVPVLYVGERLSEAIARWSQVSRDRLPVVDAPDTMGYVGELSAGDIISLYSQEVLNKESRSARLERHGGAERPETTYVQLPPEYVVAMVKLPDNFEGATLRDLDARRRFGVNVIEVKRAQGGGREQRIMPLPDSELKAGDELIVVGRPADIAHLGDPAWQAEIASAGDKARG
jgi:CBS domain-containing protein